MFVKYLLLETITQEIRSEDQIWAALDRMNGEACTILIVAEGPPGPGAEVPFSGKARAVAGGKDDQYVCEAFIRGDNSSIKVTNPGAGRLGDELVPIVRGQLELFWGRHVVGREVVEEALRAFMEDGSLSWRLSWEEPPD